MNINQTRLIISMFIEERGDAHSQHVRKGDYDVWYLDVLDDAARAFVCLPHSPRDTDSSWLSVFAPLTKLPLAASMPFCRRLLEINHKYRGRFALSISKGNVVYASTSSVIKFINDYSAFLDMVLIVVTHATLNRDILLSEFGAQHSLESSFDVPTDFLREYDTGNA